MDFTLLDVDSYRNVCFVQLLDVNTQISTFCLYTVAEPISKITKHKEKCGMAMTNPSPRGIFMMVTFSNDFKVLLQVYTDSLVGYVAQA